MSSQEQFPNLKKIGLTLGALITLTLPLTLATQASEKKSMQMIVYNNSDSTHEVKCSNSSRPLQLAPEKAETCFQEGQDGLSVIIDSNKVFYYSPLAKVGNNLRIEKNGKVSRS